MFRRSLWLAASCSIVASALLGCSGSANGSGSSTTNGSHSSSNSSSCSPDGTWAVQFQWSGRTPGALSLVVSGGSVEQESGPGVGAASGTISMNGSDLSWTLSDGSTWSGTVDSSCKSIADGTMTSSTGNPGTFSAEKGSNGGSGSGGGGGSAGGGGSSSSNEACGISFKSPACASCVAADCCSVNKACVDDASCVTLLDCIVNCGGNQSCGDNCASAAPSSALQELESATSCWSNSCGNSGC
jgi:hypothetical protein